MGAFPLRAFPGLTREELERAQMLASGRPAPITLDPTVIQARPQASQPYPTQGPLAIDPALLAQTQQETLGRAPVPTAPEFSQTGGDPGDYRQMQLAAGEPGARMPQQAAPALPAEPEDELFGRLQNEDAIAAATAKLEGRKSAARGALGEVQDERNAAMMGRMDESRARTDALRAAVYANLHAAQQAMGNVPSTTGAEIMGLIAGALSASGRGGAAALAGGASNIMMREYQRWEQGVAGYEKQNKMLQSLMGMENEGVNAELEQENKLSDLLTAQMLNGLDQFEAETKSENAKRMAARAKSEITDQWEKHKLDIAGRVQSMASERARLGMDQQRLGMERERLDAETGKRTREEDLKSQGTQIPGLRIVGDPRSISEAEQKDAREAMESQQRAFRLVDEMKKYAADGASKTAAGKYEIARNAFIGILNQKESAAGVLNPGERKNWDNIIPKHPYTAYRDSALGEGKSVLGRVTGPAVTAIDRLTTDENEVLDSAVKRTEDLTVEQLGSRRYVPESRDVLRPRGQVAGTIRVRGRDGKVASVPDSPEARAAAMQGGMQILE